MRDWWVNQNQTYRLAGEPDERARFEVAP